MNTNTSNVNTKTTANKNTGAMHFDTRGIEKNWSELKGKIKTSFDKMTDRDLDSVKEDFGLLAGKIERLYSVSKENAEKQFNEFRVSVASLLGSEKAGEKSGEVKSSHLKEALQGKEMGDASRSEVKKNLAS